MARLVLVEEKAIRRKGGSRERRLVRNSTCHLARAVCEKLQAAVPVVLVYLAVDAQYVIPRSP